MAHAKERLEAEKPLYERDFHLWVGEQVRLLKEGRFERLDMDHLIDEVEELARNQKRSIRNDLVVLLTHLFKHQFQPDHRSSGRLGSINEHRRRIQEEIDDSPSLKRYPASVLNACYEKARQQAALETGLPISRFPPTSPYDADKTLDPGFFPD